MVKQLFRIYPRGSNSMNDIHSAIDVIYDGEKMFLVGQKTPLPKEKVKEILENVRNGVYEWCINRYY